MEAIRIIDAQMELLHIPYQFMQYNCSELPMEYWVGSYQEEPIITEDGKLSATFTLTGTTRNTWADLEKRKNTILSVFRDFRTTANSKSVVISYDNAFPVPTGEDDIKRIQINLNIQEWGIS